MRPSTRVLLRKGVIHHPHGNSIRYLHISHNTPCLWALPQSLHHARLGSSDLHIIELVTVVNYYYHYYYYYYPYHYCCCSYHYYYIIVATVAIINVLSIYLFLHAGNI